MFLLNNLSIGLNDLSVIKNLNLVIKPGTVHVLMGPNGSGKSTLAYTIMGHPDYNIIDGTISFQGKNINKVPVEKRSRLGVFLACQHPQIVPGVQVFTFLKEAHRMLTGKIVSVAEFKEIIYKAFDLVGLDHSFVYRNLNEGFSGGEKKRLEVAQLLLFEPKLAILDEIDSGLDIDGLKIIAKALQYARQKNKDLSILLITHYQRMLDYVVPDYIHVLHKGRLAKSGSIDIVQEIEDKGYDGLSL